MIKTMEISSSFDELESIVDEAESFFGNCFSDDEKVYTGVLLASEMVTNAIEHGNALVESKRVFIEFRKKASTVELWVEDQGDGFVRGEIADPLNDDNLLEDGGRGIYLIEKLADKVLYEKGGRRVGVLFNL